MDTIIVEPLSGGWTVRADGVANDQVFRSGADAEDAAKALAFRLAGAGEPVRLKVNLRNSDVTARFLCLPPLDSGERPRLVDLPDLAIRAPDDERV
ncbi:hypothetical protein BH10PSE1_BH10PSE1_13330 [soil metagenome]